MNFGFIVLRHVNSPKTNKYWNQCVKLLRLFYPKNKIIIIDDNSNYEFVSNDFEYKDVTVIQSEYPKRGELLPYIYYLRYRWFNTAVIIHDSTFIHHRYPFEQIQEPVVPLWHFKYDKENIQNLVRITSSLHNNIELLKKIKNNLTVLGKNTVFDGCFGVQSVIQHSFLAKIDKKYHISRLIPAIHNRLDRCALERVIALLFFMEYPKITSHKSLFGVIFNHYKAFNYTYDEYENDFQHNNIKSPILKVWTGR